MKVFLSWSGNVSGEVAKFLNTWIPSVIQRVEPFFSDDGIEKGSRWFESVGKQLEASQFGIVILTPEAMSSEWLMFESGAITKLGRSRVVPLLIGLSPNDVRPPLSMFQMTVPTKKDIAKLLASVNAELGEAALKNDVLETAFARAWPELEVTLRKAQDDIKKSPSLQKKRTDSEKLDEVLGLLRGMERYSAAGTFSAQSLGIPAPSPDTRISVSLRDLIEEGKRDVDLDEFRRTMRELSDLVKSESAQGKAIRAIFGLDAGTADEKKQ